MADRIIIQNGGLNGVSCEWWTVVLHEVDSCIVQNPRIRRKNSVSRRGEYAVYTVFGLVFGYVFSSVFRL